MKLLLRQGTHDSEVIAVKELLRKQGYWTGEAGNKFTAALHDAVYQFQTEHQNSKGEWCKPDGVVGDETRWALKHPSGKAQRSFLQKSGSLPKGLSAQRRELLELALEHHGASERPNGSNRGPRIDKFFPKWALGTAWCCWFVTWLAKQVIGVHVLGERAGACSRAWALAKKKSMARPKASNDPTPGDAFVMLYRNSRGLLTGKGHIGIVYWVSKNGEKIATIEGNCGNRVKIGIRDLSDPNIVGFIDFWCDGHTLDVQRGLVKAANVGRAGTR